MLLASAGLILDAINEDGYTALALAVQANRVDAALLILNVGANVSIPLPDGSSVLHVAAKLSNGDDLTLLHAILDSPSLDINQVDDAGYTVLARAVEDGHDALVDLLLDAGADVSTPLPNTMTVLATAVKCGHRDMAQTLYEHMYPGPAQASPSEFQLDAAGLIARQNNGVDVYKAIYKGKSVVLKGARYANVRLLNELRGEMDEMQTYLECTSPYVLPLIAILDNGSLDPLFKSSDGKALLVSPTMVMEYMDGGDLFEALRKTPPGDDISLGVSTSGAPLQVSTIDVALVLAYALADLHRLGKVHRDVKSLNIFLSSTYYIQLADLGSARASDPGLLTSNVGPKLWMAPEVARVGNGGKGRAYGPPADIYSFGVVLTELETREPPVQGNQNEGAGLSMSAHCAPWLKTLVHRCLATDPADRPTAEDIIATLLAQLTPDAMASTTKKQPANDLFSISEEP